MPKLKVRCDKCNNTVTKTSPGLECSKCDKVVHTKSDCSGLSSKQVSALRNASNLEWTCDECQQNTPPRNSFIIPEDDEEESEASKQKLQPSKPANNAVPTIDVKKLLNDISIEVERSMRKELEEVNSNVQYCAEKMSDIEQENNELKNRIKQLENTNKNLLNNNKHLELRIAALEQRHSEYEQSRLGKYVEIIGIPPHEQENIDLIAKQVASKLKLDTNRIKTAVRINKYKGQASPIQLKLQNEQDQNQWLQVARDSNISVKDILPESEENIANNKIIIRPSLSSFNKELLWQAKQKLKESGYKYIWQKNGRILARKDDKEKVFPIRNTEDILKLVGATKSE